MQGMVALEKKQRKAKTKVEEKHHNYGTMATANTMADRVAEHRN